MNGTLRLLNILLLARNGEMVNDINLKAGKVWKVQQGRIALQITEMYYFQK
jgi:hypothetical protein